MFQQIILNQPNQNNTTTRIITPQGTIITQHQTQTQISQMQSQNGPLPQVNSLAGMQRASPRPPAPQIVKKVAVQPNNASELDDLEESITAATIPKQPVAEETQTYQAQTPLRQNNQVGGQMNFTQTHAMFSRQGQSFESPQSQQMQPMTVQSRMSQQMMMEQNSSEDDNQVVTLQNGARITLAEYKRLQQQQQLRYVISRGKRNNVCHVNIFIE